MSTGTEDVRTRLAELLATFLGMKPEEIDTTKPMADFGLDSLTALAFSSELEDAFEIDLPLNLAWEHPTVDGLSEAVASLCAEGDHR